MELVVVSMGTVLLALILISIFFSSFFFLKFFLLFLCITAERLRSGGGGPYQVWGEQWMGSLGI